MVEMLVVVAMVGIIAMVGIPTMQRLLSRIKIENVARETANLMNKARFEAVKQGVPVVVMVDPTAGEVFSFVDVHGGLDQTTPPDGLFAAIGGATPRTTDYPLGRITLPPGVEFEFQALTGLDSVDGFVNRGNPDPPDDIAIFTSEGGVLDEGAFRFADRRGNYLEARVDPRGTARVAVRMYDDVDAAWYAFGEGDKPWKWK